jgi:hypothetical protein
VVLFLTVLHPRNHVLPWVDAQGMRQSVDLQNRICGDTEFSTPLHTMQANSPVELFQLPQVIGAVLAGDLYTLEAALVSGVPLVVLPTTSLQVGG